MWSGRSGGIVSRCTCQAEESHSHGCGLQADAAHAERIHQDARAVQRVCRHRGVDPEQQQLRAAAASRARRLQGKRMVQHGVYVCTGFWSWQCLGWGEGELHEGCADKRSVTAAPAAAAPGSTSGARSCCTPQHSLTGRPGPGPWATWTAHLRARRRRVGQRRRRVGRRSAGGVRGRTGRDQLCAQNQPEERLQDVRSRARGCDNHVLR